MSYTMGESHTGNGHTSRGCIHVRGLSGTADMPGLLSADACDDSGNLTQYYVWFDSSGYMRYSSTKPTNQDNDGTRIAKYSEISGVGVDVINNTGSTIAKGVLVYISGWDATAGKFEVAKAKADSPDTLAQLVNDQELTDGSEGTASSEGSATLNTSAGAVDDPVYLSPTTAGASTLTKPTAVGHHVQRVGRVAVDAASGTVRFYLGAGCLVQLGSAFLINGAVTKTQLGTGAVTSGKLSNAAVTTSKIADSAVTQAKLADDAVGTDQISALAVTASEIGSDAITASKIADDAIGTEHLQDDTVTASEIADSAVTRSKIDGDAVGASQISHAVITTSHLVKSCITNSYVDSSAIERAAIADDAVGASQISHAVITQSHLASGVVAGSEISKSAVIASHMSSGAIVRDGLGDDAVGASEISHAVITASHLVKSCITGSYVDSSAIARAAIADDAVGASQMSHAVIANSHLTSGCVDTSQVADSAITASKLSVDNREGIVTCPIYFDSSIITAPKIYFPYSATIIKAWAFVQEQIPSAASCVLKDHAGSSMTGGALAFSSNAALGSEVSAAPTSYATIKADSHVTLSCTGSCASGKALVTLQYRRV